MSPSVPDWTTVLSEFRERGELGKILLFVVLFGGFIALLLWWQYRTTRQGSDFRQVVLDKYIQRNARRNYVLLEESISYIKGLLKADETYTLFSSQQQREEAEALVRKFKQNQLELDK